MAKFLTSNELNSEIEKLIENAKEDIVLISPYIKLHDRYASALRTKINDPNVQITVVFGKNEEDMSKSMKEEDFNFFKEFPNIEIRYEKRLHAKYYANEKASIITSMNLYSYSQDNNIETGVLSSHTFLISENSLEYQAFQYFNRVIEQADLLFKKTPEYERTMMGLSRKYINSVIEIDQLSDFFSGKTEAYIAKSNQYKKERQEKAKNQTGYCIRTGVEIPFNPEKPLSYEAYKIWNEYADPTYSEKFCHFSGEDSNGETSVERPILRKNWRKAKSIHDF